MRQIPFILALLFITLTIGRVAEFFGNDNRAYLMAIALALSVYTFAYYANFKTSQRAAIVSLVIFSLIEGYFNTVETVKWSIEMERWSFSVEGWHIYQAADIVYGIFPTIAAALLAWVGKNVERIPSGSKHAIREQISAGISNWLASILPQKEQISASTDLHVPAPSEIVPAKIAFLCQQCEKEFATVQALNAHKRFCTSTEPVLVSTNGHK